MKHLPPRTQGLIAINIAAVIFGSAALYGKLPVSPFWIVVMRAAFAVLGLIVFGFLKKELALPPRHLIFVLLTTGVILTVHWLMFFLAVQLSGVAIATLAFATFPLFTVLIAAWLQRRKPYAVEILAAAAIVIAVALLVNPRSSQGSFLGLVAGLTSGLTFAWFGHASKKLGHQLSPLLISVYQNGVVAIVIAPFLPLVKNAPSTPGQWLCLVLLGVFTTALMHQLYFYSLRRLSASTCSGFVALEPVYAIIFAAIFFHEPMTIWVIISAVLIIGASFVLLKVEEYS